MSGRALESRASSLRSSRQRSNRREQVCGSHRPDFWAEGKRSRARVDHVEVVEAHYGMRFFPAGPSWVADERVKGFEAEQRVEKPSSA